MQKTKSPKRRGQWIRPEILRLLRRREITPKQAMVLAVISNLSQANNGKGCYSGNNFLSECAVVNSMPPMLTKLRQINMLADNGTSVGRRLLCCNFAIRKKRTAMQVLKAKEKARTKAREKAVTRHGIWIRPEIMKLLQARTINHTEAFLLAVIDNLSSSELRCRARNAYLAKKLGRTESSVAHALVNLRKKDLVVSEIGANDMRLLECRFDTIITAVSDDHLFAAPDAKNDDNVQNFASDITQKGFQTLASPDASQRKGRCKSLKPYNKHDKKEEREGNKLPSHVVFRGVSPSETLAQNGVVEFQLPSLGKPVRKTRLATTKSKPSNPKNRHITPKKQSRTITTNQPLLSKSFALNTSNPKDKRSIPIREIDKQHAKEFHQIVCQHGILPKWLKVNPATWYKWMYRISTKFGEEYLDRVLEFLKEHGADKYCPKPRTAMQLFRSVQEGAFEAAFKREEEHNPNVTITEDAKRIARRLHNNIWPDNSEEKIPAAVQLSLNNLNQWRAILKRIRLEAHQRRLADHVIQTLWYDTELVATWFESLFDRIWDWPEWHGDPLREVLNPFDTDSRNRFTRDCQRIAGAYTEKGGELWSTILEAVRDARQ